MNHPLMILESLVAPQSSRDPWEVAQGQSSAQILSSKFTL
jgi:hypothetical protein